MGWCKPGNNTGSVMRLSFKSLKTTSIPQNDEENSTCRGWSLLHTNGTRRLWFLRRISASVQFLVSGTSCCSRSMPLFDLSSSASSTHLASFDPASRIPCNVLYRSNPVTNLCWLILISLWRFS